MSTEAEGPAGNARLTATTAVVLLILLAVEGSTLLALRSLLAVHVFVGMLLIPVVTLKLLSTGYRFARYYTRNVLYVEAGPPRIVLRSIAPLVVVTTAALFATGVVLVAHGPPSGRALQLHKLAFVAWFAVMSVHVLLHLPRMARLAAAEWRARRPGVRVRTVTVTAAVAGGLLLAGATLTLATPWEHWESVHSHDDGGRR